MSTQTVRITGHPTKADADRTVRIWKLEPSYVPNSGRTFQEGETWTAEAQFYVTSSSPSASMAAARPAARPASMASLAAAPFRPKVDPALHSPLAAQGFARVLAVLAPSPNAAATSEAVARNILMTPDTVAAARTELALASGRKPAKGGLGASAVRIFPRLNVILGYADRPRLQAAASDPGVQAVYAAPALSLIRPVASAAAKPTGTVTWGLERLNVPKLWSESINGNGVSIAHIDTGVDGTHSALKSALKRGEFAFFDLAGNRVSKAKPTDSAEHGTHTAGTICGGRIGKLSIGVAPGAALFSAAVIEGGDVLMRILSGLEWALENSVSVLSMSLGIRGYTPFFRDVMQALRRHNCLPVVAIGNECAGSTRSPGNYPESLSVGASDRNDAVADFSSSGEFQNPPREEPNVVAPGVDVISCVPGGAAAAMDGTSMATPHVAGVAALLMQAFPKAPVDQIEAAIFSTARKLPGVPDARQGFGLVDAWAALRAL